MFRLALLLLACPAADDPKPDDTGTPGDSGPVDTADPDSGDAETGDPDTGADIGLECGELLNPWPVASPEDAWSAAGLAGPPVVQLTSFDDEALTWARFSADAFGCPTITEDEVSGAVSISGECDNVMGSGSGTATFLSSAEGGYVSTYEAFSFESYDSGLRFAADGTWSYDTASVSFDVAVDYSWGGEGEDWAVIDWALEGEFGDATHMEGRVDVTDSPSGGGSFCILMDYPAYSGTCTEESPGTIGIQGSAYAEFVFDPDAAPACDGCAEVTIDGEDEGLYCP